MNIRKITLPTIGEILLKKDNRFKRLSIRVSPLKGIYVNIPRGYSFSMGKRFAQENLHWLKKQHEKLQKKSDNIFDFDTRFNTRFHRLNLLNGKAAKLQTRITDSSIDVYIPEGSDIYSTNIQEFITYSIIETLRLEAKQILPDRVEALAKQHGFTYTSISIRNAKTRWGSCSMKNTLNFSLYLMLLPDHLIDYVILHELCHTIEKNHSSKFWQLLDQKMENVGKYRKELRKFSHLDFLNDHFKT